MSKLQQRKHYKLHWQNLYIIYISCYKVHKLQQLHPHNIQHRMLFCKTDYRDHKSQSYHYLQSHKCTGSQQYSKQKLCCMLHQYRLHLNHRSSMISNIFHKGEFRHWLHNLQGNFHHKFQSMGYNKVDHCIRSKSKQNPVHTSLYYILRKQFPPDRTCNPLNNLSRCYQLIRRYILGMYRSSFHYNTCMIQYKYRILGIHCKLHIWYSKRHNSQYLIGNSHLHIQ